MYSNDYDDGSLMNAYIRWSRRQTISTESEAVRADEEFCAKCRGEEDENAAAFPHIQDLCPADRRRIAQLVKQLIKCTKETRDARSELVVSESEKQAMRTQYQKTLDRREHEAKELELQLHEARSEANELRTRMSRMLELLTRQIAEQEKQFLGLTETVRDLVREKSRLQETVDRKQTESDTLREKFQRTREQLETERLRHVVDPAEKVHRACQTEEIETVTLHKRSFQRELNECTSHQPQNLKVKSSADLEEPSMDGTLLGELFFRRLNVEENGTLDIIPILSEPPLQMKRSSSLLFI